MFPPYYHSTLIFRTRRIYPGLYFADNEDALAESGSSTKPREIPNSPYWVITNSNTTRKKMMLTEVSLALGYDLKAAEKIRDLL